MQPMTERAPFLKLVYSRPATGTATAGPRQSGERRPGHRPQREGGSDPHFAHWVDTYLQDMYDGIVEQPLPDEIARLIEGISDKSRDSGKK